MERTYETRLASLLAPFRLWLLLLLLSRGTLDEEAEINLNILPTLGGLGSVSITTIGLVQLGLGAHWARVQHIGTWQRRDAINVLV